jgi:ribonuclease E
LYVLNQKRGHLRDLEHSFKVGLSVVADPSIAGQQSFIIDRGEQVHTLEAAKALLAAQLAASPPQAEEAYEDEQPLDIEAEIETGDTEGRADEPAAGEAEGDGRKRRRRRPRRERSGEASDDQTAHGDEGSDNVQIAADFAAARFMTGDLGNDGGDAGVQDGDARADQPSDGESRPRRRGRRGGRRRRGSADAGLVGSISDELGPPSAPEVVEAVADFDSVPIAPEPQAGSPDIEAPPQHTATQPEMKSPPPPVEARDEAESEKAVRRRSTVREKVSFASEAPPVAPVVQSQPEPSAPEPQQPAEASNEVRPRRAGWWSRRFGSGT